MLRVVLPFYHEFKAAKPGLRSLRDAGVKFDFCPIQGPLIFMSRNAGVNDARSQKVRQPALEGYDHFLFLDSDIGFRAADVTTALKLDKDIVVSPYARHEADGLYQCGELAEIPRATIAMRYAMYQTGVRRITYAGAGFMLVKRHVFEKMRYPWFRHILITDGDSQEMSGEDVGFCVNAQESGAQIWCNFENPVSHSLRRAEDYDASF